MQAGRLDRTHWKYLQTAKDPSLGPEQNLGAIGATYNLTMDPFEKYDMTLNGDAPMRVMTTSPGRYAGQDNGWLLSLIEPVILEFDKTIMKYPNINRSPEPRLDRPGSGSAASPQSLAPTEGPAGAVRPRRGRLSGTLQTQRKGGGVD